MRKYMTKEITYTVCKVAKIEVIGGLPSAVVLPEFQILGNVSEERCLKAVQKEHGATASIYEYGTFSATYKMKVTDFLLHAELVTPESDDTEEEIEDGIE